MQRLKPAAIAASFLIAGLGGCVSAGPDDPPALPASPVSAVLDTQKDFSGTVLVADGGEIVFEQARGLANDAEGRAITLEDTWRWASVTKQIVAVLILQEVEAGRLTLDAEVDALLPGLTGGRLGGVTVKDLLQHTSGLNNPENLDLEIFNTSFDWRSFCTEAPAAAPSGQFSYNNCDYLLLGEIIGAVSGAPWDAQLKSRILAPAGMARTGVAGVPDAETVQGYAAKGVQSERHNLAKFGAAGAITGDARDLVKFDSALMTGKLLSAKSRAVLWAGEPALGYQALGAWSFPAALKGCDAPVDLIERRGDIGGIQVRNLIAPGRDRSLIVFANRGDLDFGEIWMKSGFSFDLASAAFCDRPD